jgi:hypothetical protein
MGNLTLNFNFGQTRSINLSHPSSLLNSASVFAQSLLPEKVSQIVYEQMPELPRENDYSEKETGKQATENTLIARIVRYHQYIKARPTRFRLDWKLTLADYFGKNEMIIEERYPGYTTLSQNPLPRDREAITNLTLQQRQQLVDLLVNIYLSPNPGQTNFNPNSNQEKKDKPADESNQPPSNSPRFQLPKPGGAELLLP